MKFYLGTHKTYWLGRDDFRGVPLFLSHAQLGHRAAMPPVVTTWALDSGGFSQLTRHPEGWPSRCEEPYVQAVHRYAEAGGLEWATQQDWMCEPWLLHGRTVAEHQERTVGNYLRLRELAPDLPWLPVLQGWTVDDYLRCLGLFQAAGVPLADLGRVGVGSVCRRQHTAEIGQIMSALQSRGLRLHGFGVKTHGLVRYGDLLASADSGAWSRDARYARPMAGCHHGVHGTGSCANCPRWALRWRARLLAQQQGG